MDQLVQDLTQYLDFLETEHGLTVTLHDVNGFLAPYMDQLARYNIHQNGFCLFVKSNQEIWSACIARQDKVMQCCAEGMLFGSCHFGVAEFVLPVCHEDTRLGFLCVSGYRTDQQDDLLKLAHAAEKFGLPEKRLRRIYHDALKPEIPDSGWIRKAVAPAAYLLELIYMKSDFDSAAGSGDIYERLCAILHRRFAQKLTLSQLAAEVHCSRSYVSHMFRSRSGVTLRGYINQLRVEEAKRLLRSTKISISETAYMAGFESANYFTGVFSKLVGMPPRLYRKQWKG